MKASAACCGSVVEVLFTSARRGTGQQDLGASVGVFLEEMPPIPTWTGSIGLRDVGGRERLSPSDRRMIMSSFPERYDTGHPCTGQHVVLFGWSAESEVDMTEFAS